MAEVIAVANQKGGVGKTTTAINVASALAYLSQETLLVDMDPQGNTTSGLGIDKSVEKNTIYEILLESIPIEVGIKRSPVEWLDIVCSNKNLIGAEIELVSGLARESRLKNALESIKRMYKYIIVDTPPSLGLLAINALAAADKVLVPIQCEYYALEGLACFIDTINKVKMAINPYLEIDGPIFTMFDHRASLFNQVKSEVERLFREKSFKTTIPRNVRLAEAPSFGQPIFLYDPHSRGAEAYMDLAIEFLSRRGVQGIEKVPLAEPNIVSTAGTY